MTDLLVNSFNGDDVLRYDATTGFFIDEFVPAGNGGLDGAAGMTFGPDGNLYVSSWETNSVLRYDGATGAFLDIFAFGNVFNPWGIIFGPDGNLYVNSSSSDQVLRYDGTTGAFLDVFAAGGGLDRPSGGITFGSDGNLYVSSWFGDQVLRYDGRTGFFIDVFASGGGLDNPDGLTFGPDGNLYVSNRENDSVLRYDETTGLFLDVFAAGSGLDGPADITFGPDGNLYVSSVFTDSVLRYDGTTGEFLDVFAAGGGLDSPQTLVFTDDSPPPTLQQIVTPETPIVAATPDTIVSFDVNYSTNPGNTPTTGLGLRIHYNSSQISFTDLTNTLSAGEQPTSEPQLDIEDFDDDPETDFYILKAWTDFDGNWPSANPTDPERLFTANFVTEADFSETTVNFSDASIAGSASFESTSVEIQSQFNLDIDGNRDTDALTDGLLALRYLFDFRGNTLIDEVLGPGATRETASEISDYLDEARDIILDVDGNGMADALTDGILFIRYLFGFRGETLISNAVALDATRFTASQIEAHLGAFDLL